ncbi:MAG: hypothetical protein ACLGIA_13005 [Actinomycetes bacterium]
MVSAPARVARLVVLAAVLVPAAGCGAGRPDGPSTVTVTATASPTTTQTEGGDVRGRAHDVGTITDVRHVDSRLLLTLDRWTVDRMDDAALATQGAPVVPHTGDRFANLNAAKTYTVPVASDAVLVVNECQPATTPGGVPGLTSRRGDLEAFLAQPGLAAQVVLLTYNRDGELVQIDTDPRCG